MSHTLKFTKSPGDTGLFADGQNHRYFITKSGASWTLEVWPLQDAGDLQGSDESVLSTIVDLKRIAVSTAQEFENQARSPQVPQAKIDRRRKGEGDWRMEPNALYRMFNADGELLYVGISLDLQRRLHEHRILKDFWRDIAHIDLEWFPNRDAALEAERTAAATESPKYGRTPADFAEYGRRGGAARQRRAALQQGSSVPRRTRAKVTKTPKFKPSRGKGMDRDIFYAACTDKTVGELHRDLLSKL